jgi:ADP-ribosylation factor GTPase-activating protein 2/3
VHLTETRSPEQVVITDAADDAARESDGNTPSGEPGSDFFASWDKPTIKRPSNPPSRTGTPGRTASPFLVAASNGGGRPKSPLTSAPADGSAKPAGPAAAARTVTTSSAIRKTGVGARKANLLTGGAGGAKKGKLGAKKVAAAPVATDADAEDPFEAAERKAKEEAERIAELGYDPDDEEAVAAAAAAAAAAAKAAAGDIVSPTPVSPGRGAAAARIERRSGDVERLGMGVARLGFGQTMSKKPAGGAAKKSGGGGGFGFGATSRPAPSEEGISSSPPSY